MFPHLGTSIMNYAVKVKGNLSRGGGSGGGGERARGFHNNSYL